MPFSRGAKRVFEAALAASQSAGMNYIAPEHVAVAAATLDDDALVAFFAAMNADRAAVNAEAERRLKGEREREGNNRSSGPSSPAARGAGVDARRRFRREGVVGKVAARGLLLRPDGSARGRTRSTRSSAATRRSSA